MLTEAVVVPWLQWKRYAHAYPSPNDDVPLERLDRPMFGIRSEHKVASSDGRQASGPCCDSLVDWPANCFCDSLCVRACLRPPLRRQALVTGSSAHPVSRNRYSFLLYYRLSLANWLGWHITPLPPLRLPSYLVKADDTDWGVSFFLLFCTQNYQPSDRSTYRQADGLTGEKTGGMGDRTDDGSVSRAVGRSGGIFLKLNFATASGAAVRRDDVSEPGQVSVNGPRPDGGGETFAWHARNDLNKKHRASLILEDASAR
ncbi:unnamed protein product [Soboliphyme baturini]|uniref:Uncharacterized protein n=1 Tax=Soboliphyme baturini TaxID=241478 RepID=A0A183IDT4_9BILA|nr:unnamed protein product [Soboliphyme baturini]